MSTRSTRLTKSNEVDEVDEELDGGSDEGESTSKTKRVSVEQSHPRVRQSRLRAAPGRDMSRKRRVDENEEGGRRSLLRGFNAGSRRRQPPGDSRPRR